MILEWEWILEPGSENSKKTQQDGVTDGQQLASIIPFILESGKGLHNTQPFSSGVQDLHLAPPRHEYTKFLLVPLHSNFKLEISFEVRAQPSAPSSTMIHTHENTNSREQMPKNLEPEVWKFVV